MEVILLVNVIHEWVDIIGWSFLYRYSSLLTGPLVTFRPSKWISTPKLALITTSNYFVFQRHHLGVNAVERTGIDLNNSVQRVQALKFPEPFIGQMPTKSGYESVALSWHGIGYFSILGTLF